MRRRKTHQRNKRLAERRRGQRQPDPSRILIHRTEPPRRRPSHDGGLRRVRVCCARPATEPLASARRASAGCLDSRPVGLRSFTPEFKAEIVELCQRGDRTVRQVSQDFDLTETAVREWVKQADLDTGARNDGLTSSERDELAQLRRENRRLREDVDILKRATAFFAKETR